MPFNSYVAVNLVNASKYLHLGFKFIQICGDLAMPVCTMLMMGYKLVLLVNYISLVALVQTNEACWLMGYILVKGTIVSVVSKLSL